MSVVEYLDEFLYARSFWHKFYPSISATKKWLGGVRDPMVVAFLHKNVMKKMPIDKLPEYFNERANNNSYFNKVIHRPLDPTKIRNPNLSPKFKFDLNSA